MAFGEGGLGERRDLERIYQEVDFILAWLVEKGAEDSSKASAARQALYQHLNSLGVVNSNGQMDLNSWSDFVASQAHRKNNPVKPEDYPDFVLFKQKYEEYKVTRPDLDQLKRHTNDLPGYLYGLGIIMTDKIVYESIFENDDIQIRNGEVTNGKHREAAVDILRACNYSKTTPWVKLDYED